MGPMFSGKTSSLISELTRYVDVDIPVIYINSADDTRAEESYSTHNSSYSKISAKIKTCKVNKLMDLESSIDSYGVLAIDESQFFSDLVPFAKLCLRMKKIIYVAGLDGDARQQIFGDLVNLIPYASEIRKLNAVCEQCKKRNLIVNAPFTIKHNRSCNEPGTHEKKQIGGKDIYLPVCSDCLFESKSVCVQKNATEFQDSLQSLNYVI
jgi:thymidine kinase